MNKREFYRRLMSEYTFDSDKVRRAAKRSSIRMLPPDRVRSAGAIAAALAVAVGVISLSAYFTRADDIPVETPTHVPAAKTDRLLTAENDLKKYSDSLEVKTMYLSFGEELNYTKLRNTIEYVSDTGKIQIDALYVLDDDGEVVTVTNPEEIEVIKNDEAAKIIGAKVSAPANLGEILINQPEIILAEIEPENVDIETFIPLSADPEINDYATPDDTTTHTEQSSFESQTPDASLTEGTTDPDPMSGGSTTEPGTETSSEETGPAETAASETSETPASTAATVPQERFIELSLPGVTDAEFIGDRIFVALSKDGVGIYKINGDADLTVDCEASFAVQNARKRSSASGNSFLISGCGATKLRTLLFLADGKTGTLEKLDITAVLGDPKDKSELMFAFYDDATNKIIARASGKGYNAFYLIDRTTKQTTEVLRTKDDAAVLTLTEHALYYSLTKSAQKSTSVCKLDFASGIAEELYIFAGAVSFDRSDNLKNFSVSSDSAKTSQVFVIETDRLTLPVQTSYALMFRDNSDSALSDGEKNYVLVLGELVETATVADAPKKAGSALFTVAEINGDKLKIKVRDK